MPEIAASDGIEGETVPRDTVTGAVSTLISSHNPASMNWRWVYAPPSTISDCTLRSYRHSISCGSIGRAGSIPVKHGFLESRIRRIGSFPHHALTVSDGLSLNAVV